MAIRGHGLTSLIALAGICLAGTGCVTEYGRPKASLWTSIESKDDIPQRIKLKNPGRMHLIAAQVAEKRQLHADARKHYESALAENPRSVDAILGMARLDQHAGRIGSARKGFDRAMQMAPNNDEVLDSVGMFYASQNQWQQAVALLQRAVSAVPDDKDHRFHLAVVLAKSGNHGAAMPHLVAAVGRPRAHYHMGYLLYEQGRNADAIREFQIALSLQPELEEPKVMLSKLGFGRAPRQAVASGGGTHLGQRRLDRRPIRSAGHTSPSHSAGTQTGWRYETPHRIPGTQPAPSHGGPVITPGPARGGMTITPNAHGSVSAQPLQQPAANPGIVIPPPYYGNVR